MKIAVCDDDETSAVILKEIIEAYPKGKYLPDLYSSGEDFLESDKSYDLLFLDIDMKGMDGIETARRIRIHDRKIKIVYVTAYGEYAGQAFSVHAFGYLLKPVRKERVWRQLEDALKWRQEEIPRAEKLEFYTSQGYVRMPAEAISYFEYRNRRILMKAERQVYELNGKISDMAERMKKYGFAVPHKSFVVNLYHVKNIKGYEVLLMNGDSIPLSQKKAVKFKDELNLYLAEETER